MIIRAYGTVSSDDLIMYRIAYYIIPVERKLIINSAPDKETYPILMS